ncbi:hypothetical protein HJFPF1_00141 [Paramyrothecium foliicola]|nr:hypothetical protein HJFPF1_00141 [Paramyrothecium foliicola]
MDLAINSKLWAYQVDPIIPDRPRKLMVRYRPGGLHATTLFRRGEYIDNIDSPSAEMYWHPRELDIQGCAPRELALVVALIFRSRVSAHKARFLATYGPMRGLRMLHRLHQPLAYLVTRVDQDTRNLFLLVDRDETGLRRLLNITRTTNYDPPRVFFFEEWVTPVSADLTMNRAQAWSIDITTFCRQYRAQHPGDPTATGDTTTTGGTTTTDEWPEVEVENLLLIHDLLHGESVTLCDPAIAPPDPVTTYGRNLAEGAQNLTMAISKELDDLEEFAKNVVGSWNVQNSSGRSIESLGSFLDVQSILIFSTDEDGIAAGLDAMAEYFYLGLLTPLLSLKQRTKDSTWLAYAFTWVKGAFASRQPFPTSNYLGSMPALHIALFIDKVFAMAFQDEYPGPNASPLMNLAPETWALIVSFTPQMEDDGYNNLKGICLASKTLRNVYMHRTFRYISFQSGIPRKVQQLLRGNSIQGCAQVRDHASSDVDNLPQALHRLLHGMNKLRRLTLIVDEPSDGGYSARLEQYHRVFSKSPAFKLQFLETTACDYVTKVFIQYAEEIRVYRPCEAGEAPTPSVMQHLRTHQPKLRALKIQGKPSEADSEPRAVDATLLYGALRGFPFLQRLVLCDSFLDQPRTFTSFMAFQARLIALLNEHPVLGRLLFLLRHVIAVRVALTRPGPPRVPRTPEEDLIEQNCNMSDDYWIDGFLEDELEDSIENVRFEYTDFIMNVGRAVPRMKEVSVSGRGLTCSGFRTEGVEDLILRERRTQSFSEPEDNFLMAAVDRAH